MIPAHWLPPTVMHPLAWALLHFLWQGTALAALAAVVMTLCRKASVRYTVGVGTLVLMLAAPVATFLSYRQVDTAVPSVTMPVSTAAVQSHAPKPAQSLTSQSQVSAPEIFPGLDVFPWLIEAWFVGVMFFSLRYAGGVLQLERMRRREAVAINARMLAISLALQRRLRLTRIVRYCECTWLDAPAVMGWFRPIVFLPVTALTGLSQDQLQAVIAHELAHIKRLDAFVNAFQIAAETILFYHPAIWWLNRRIRAERENSCDDVAIALCGNAVEYARALTLMEEWRSAPSLAMAANRGPLTVRVARLLGLSHLQSGMLSSSVRGLGVAASVLCLTAALTAGMATVGIARPSAAAQSVTTQSGLASSNAPQSSAGQASPPLSPTLSARPGTTAKSLPEAKPASVAVSAAPSAPPSVKKTCNKRRRPKTSTKQPT
jgi:beta-lactamase regulating signal transducer with metallopeptidase domain